MKATASLPLHGRVGVDHRGDVVDQADVQLRHHVAGRGLAREHVGARHAARVGIALERQVVRDDLQAGQQLALVFVDALDLHDEHRVGRSRRRRSVARHQLGGVALVGLLDRVQRRPAGPRRRRTRSAPAAATARADRSSSNRCGCVSRRVSRGFACSSQRRGVTPLVLLLNFSGHSS